MHYQAPRAPPHDEPFESFRKRMTAAQCREHRWLARKMNKTRSEKEVAGLVAAKRMAFIENRPIVNIRDQSSEELDMTKDNLRLFVERWREHPDSPYTIDSYHSLPKNSRSRDHDESVSLRGHSPSPCDSLRSSSTSQSEKVMDSVRDNYSTHLLSVPSFSLTLERRASEGTAARNRRDPASQIALAEEIIKLSEHLRSIAIGSSENEDDNEHETKVQHSSKRPDIENNRNTYSKSNVTVTVSDDKETNEITEKLSSITRQRKLNGTTFHSSRSFDRHDIDTNPENVFVALRRTSISDGETSGRYKQDEKYSFERTTIEEKFNGKTIGKKMSFQTSSVKNDKEMDLTPPWRRPRVKRPLGETSRDVPRISSLRDLHKNLNLNEPGSTKDLLLQLLGEWEDVTAISCSGGAGRKSVSLDCTANTIARKTMNSLAEYFQSKQQKEKSPDVASPSIYH